MTRRHRTSPEQFLQQLISADDLRQAARQTGFVRRRRKIEPVAFLMATVLGICGRAGQSLAEMRRLFAAQTGMRVARSAFWKRFTPQFEALVTWLLCQLQRRAEQRRPKYVGVLAGFRDVVAVDATVIKVHDSLRWLWKGARTNSAGAAVKVHTWVRALTGELLHHRITAETHADVKAFAVTWKDAGKLFLFDRGYPSASLWWRIHKVGAYFMTRLPASYRPTIVALNRTHRGRARKLVGGELYEVTRGLKRKVIDVDCSFRVHIRGYAGGLGRYEEQVLRVVGLWNDGQRRYHFYITNLRPQRMEPESFTDVYRLRWEVETFYKTAKGGLGLNELPSEQPHIVGTLLRAALVRASIAMQAKYEADKHVAHRRWINPKMWTSVWSQVVNDLLAAVLLGRPQHTASAWSFLAALAVDDNKNRPPTRWRTNQPNGVETQSLLNSIA
jgi:putative transposase